MAATSMTPVIQQLRSLAAGPAHRHFSDGQLLERFAQRHDEAAFEALVARHGGMVLGVCRRVLRHQHDAEDAFQAAFLVLARKAGSIRKHESVASWLHGVARRIALQAKASAARRTARDARASATASDAPLSGMTWEEIAPLLDQELAGMSENHRAPLVLCYLQGKTRDEAAKQLGWSLRTLMRRLEQGRELLRARLTRQGVTIGAALLTAGLTSSAAPAAVPALFLKATVAAALAFTPGNPANSIVSAKVVALAKGALTAMLIGKLRIGALVLTILCGLMGASMFALPVSSGQAEPAAKNKSSAGPRTPPPAAPQPADTRAPGRLLFYRAGHLTLINPDGKEERQTSKDRGDFHPGSAWLSPDRKRIAFLVQVDKDPVENRDPRRKVYVRGLDEPEPGTDLNVEAQELIWSPKGDQLVAVDFVHGDQPGDITFVNWLVDVNTKEKSVLKLPDHHVVQDWSRDGKHFLTTVYDVRKKPPTARMFLVNRDGSNARALTDGKQPIFDGRLSPDGRKMLYQAPDPQRKVSDRPGNFGLFVLDLPSGTSKRIEQQPLNGEFMGYSWSPNGKRIAYAWRQLHEQQAPNQETESYLVIADADGNNAITIATEKAPNSGLITIGGIDWR